MSRPFLALVSALVALVAVVFAARVGEGDDDLLVAKDDPPEAEEAALTEETPAASDAGLTEETQAEADNGASDEAQAESGDGDEDAEPVSDAVFTPPPTNPPLEDTPCKGCLLPKGACVLPFLYDGEGNKENIPLDQNLCEAHKGKWSTPDAPVSEANQEKDDDDEDDS
eukprot:TRINITY_DN91038_c0_g1_i1.p1 TRINITY_DN91038_c0_g1~~TRINITY_DN91038_c0_g1_i1.p1  ORF type:complete len:169 (+),score=59.50 TRINITY_DN91038_c0_g1_i1:101-607(+)